MSPQEYLDALRFPVSTQDGLTLSQQMMIDAFNLDEGRQALENGEELSERSQAAMKELEEKAKHWPSLKPHLGKRSSGR
jgi:hypothetical protein